MPQLGKTTHSHTYPTGNQVWHIRAIISICNIIMIDDMADENRHPPHLFVSSLLMELAPLIQKKKTWDHVLDLFTYGRMQNTKQIALQIATHYGDICILVFPHATALAPYCDHYCLGLHSQSVRLSLNDLIRDRWPQQKNLNSTCSKTYVA